MDESRLSTGATADPADDLRRQGTRGFQRFGVSGSGKEKIDPVQLPAFPLSPLLSDKPVTNAALLPLRPLVVLGPGDVVAEFGGSVWRLRIADTHPLIPSEEGNRGNCRGSTACGVSSDSAIEKRYYCWTRGCGGGRIREVL